MEEKIGACMLLVSWQSLFMDPLSQLDSSAPGSPPLPCQKDLAKGGRKQGIHVMTKVKYFLAAQLMCKLVLARKSAKEFFS